VGSGTAKQARTDAKVHRAVKARKKQTNMGRIRPAN